MRSTIVFALGAFVAAVAADRENPFNVPPGGYQFQANIPTTLTWRPTTSSTVTIKLQKAGDITPSSGIVLARRYPLYCDMLSSQTPNFTSAHIANTGSFAFVPPANLGPGSDYTIQIVDDKNPANINFTPQFAVSGTTGTGTALTGAPSPTASPSSSPTPSSSLSMTISSMISTVSSRVSSSAHSASSSASSTSSSSSSSARPSSSSSSSLTSTTARPSQTEQVPNPNGASSLVLPGSLLSAVFGLMALL
ncbi:hypothetical protein LOZ12_005120 [Ophidiomyces ophidiicola]|uniref:uncharacterized protein n=1 Tax=Ophidiomyces ophidiicola TaxID=1387563 RepID=UPI0020C2C095|nr:uncharacterized protein LOZ57_003759 [Ophidiomyces ophidiicola]KAI1908722.1 hypothetical protein LOZ64_005482 [Ophidiomyces ophidiicola]KAI1937500.1 hypothetical protein LOZ62_005431 [Ophidiomyces ophidiicola]KAI1946504.1 hypothetical protein LOZ57_003759 [Ophidiomyces ophidiicola]KAI2035095.1 hypothetical protein LOZ47_004742 [Ophidiomyces ophidiicola]KAI2048361.1 hypothetical protein LOZ43_005416 [Ophidiomyces ophidiicola]